ncbi:hypothetical protein BDD12DRAFT_676141, partial [Trichophaea hybrida]
DRQRAYTGNTQVFLHHFRRLRTFLNKKRMKLKAITNVDENVFVMVMFALTKLITQMGKKSPCVTQSGIREFIARFEALSANVNIFSPYLIGNGSKHIFDWFQDVTNEDRLVHWAVSLQDWTDHNTRYDWL